MKILFVVTSRVIKDTGGVARAISTFANEFVKRGHQAECVCMREQKGGFYFPLDTRARFTNLFYQKAPFNRLCYFMSKIGTEFSKLTVKLGLQNNNTRWDPKRKYFERKFVARLRKYIASSRPDIILTDQPQALYLAQKAAKGEIPIVGQTHSAPVAFQNLNACESKAFAWADAVQVLMPSYVDFFGRLGAKKVVYIPNAVKQVSEENLADLNNDHCTIINISRLEHNKGQHLLLEAFGILAHQYPNWKLVIYGGDSGSCRYTKFLKKIVEKYDIQRQVIFAGVTADVQEALKRGDIFVFPSAYEGFPLALTEAMSMGLPVIGYKSCPGVNELISSGENGLLCEDGAGPLAKAMETLMQDQELRINYGRNAHEAMKKFAPERVYDRWEQLLKETIEAHRTAEEILRQKFLNNQKVRHF